MASTKMKLANQENAQHSTGPKSDQGKGVVRYNAVKHGLKAEHMLLSHEDADALDKLREGLIAELDPYGPLQWTLFDLILSKLWRLRRACTAETGGLSDAIDMGVFGTIGNMQETITRYLSGSRLVEYERTIENSLYKALAQYNALRHPVCSYE